LSNPDFDPLTKSFSEIQFDLVGPYID
jgi:hypothetical protein